MSERIRVWCLRHGEATYGAIPTAESWLTRPLTARGREQAIAAAQLLAVEPITRVYSSTLLRAQQTAALVATPLGLPITLMPELVEVSVSENGLRASVVEQDLGRRGTDGETGHQVVSRITVAFRTIATLHPGETVVVVGHVASLTVGLGQLCSLGSKVWGTPLPYAQPFRVEWDGHAWHCPAWPALG